MCTCMYLHMSSNFRLLFNWVTHVIKIIIYHQFYRLLEWQRVSESIPDSIRWRWHLFLRFLRKNCQWRFRPHFLPRIDQLFAFNIFPCHTIRYLCERVSVILIDFLGQATTSFTRGNSLVSFGAIVNNVDSPIIVKRGLVVLTYIRRYIGYLGCDLFGKYYHSWESISIFLFVDDDGDSNNNVLYKDVPSDL